MRVTSSTFTIAEYCQQMKDKGIIVNHEYQRSEKVWPPAARSYLIDTVTEIYRRAGPMAPIDVMDRARARLAGSHAITSAVAVADTTYKAAGVDAIFPGSPFERRFRDIHTVSQQIQSRNAHYETVGQVLLGQPPEVFL